MARDGSPPRHPGFRFPDAPPLRASVDTSTMRIGEAARDAAATGEVRCRAATPGPSGARELATAEKADGSPQPGSGHRRHAAMIP